MRHFKGLIVIFFIIFLFFVGITFLLPRNVTLAKSVDIFSPKEQVTTRIHDFDDWPQWFLSEREKRNTLKVMSENEAQIDDANGKILTISRLYPDRDTLVFELKSSKGHPIEMDFQLDSLQSNLTRLTLMIHTRLNWYPWDRLRSVFYDKVMGGNFQQMVDNIKKESEL